MGVAFALTCSTQLFAQQQPDQKRETPPAVQAALDRLVGKLKASDLDGMFAEYRNQAIITNEEPFLRLQLHVKTARTPLLQNIGQLVDVEPVARFDAGDSLIRFIYVEKYELGVFVWTFTAYRARDEWRFLGINFTNDLDSVFRSGNQS